MKESKLYLNFFKKNILIFFTFLLVSVLILIWYQIHQGVIYQGQRLYEFKFTGDNVSQKIAEVDEAVTVLRSGNLQLQLGLTGASLTIFKPGPLSVQIESVSTDRSVAKNNLDKLSNYLESHYSAGKIGQDIFPQSYPNIFPPAVIFIGIGFLGALIVSLIKCYLENY